MSRVLGQIQASPPNGLSWEQYKAFVFGLAQYEMYADEVRDFHRSEARLRIVTAPARGSKSYAAGHDVLPYCLLTEPMCSSLHWIVGPTYETNKEWDYLWDFLVERRDRHGFRIAKARNNPGNGDMLIVLEQGRDEKGHMCRTVLRGMSSTNERALQGEEVTTAVLSEAAEHPAHILSKYLETRCWKIICPTTPKPYAEWLRELSEKGERDASLGIDSFRFPRHANPLYDHARYEEAKRRAAMRSPTGKAEDDPRFAEQFLGLWVYYTGMVLPFNPARNVIPRDKIDPARHRIFISLDYGYKDASVALFWSIRPDGLLVIFDEIYQPKWTAQQFVTAIREKAEPYMGNLTYVVGDPSRPEVTPELQRYGLPIWGHLRAKKTNIRDRAAGFTRLRDVLVEGPLEGFPGLYVTDNCKATIYEWNHLRFKDGAKNEFANGTFDGDDHAADAARYGLLSRPTPAPMDAAPVWNPSAKPKSDVPRWARRLLRREGQPWAA